MRYTGKKLELDVVRLNQKLADLGHEFRFIVGYRYGCTVIDLATPGQIDRHCCHSMLFRGTPRGCLAECHAYINAMLI